MKITLEKILRDLSHDSLSFMSDSNFSNGVIVPDQIPKVLSRVNAVLRRLSTKFVLHEKSVMIRVTDRRRDYSLNKGDAWIIDDEDNPFIGDVGRILGIEMPDGRMQGLNDKAKHDSIMLRDDGRALVFDDFLMSGVYTVIYKAATPQFEESMEPNLSQVLDIPEALLNALYLGVAAMTYEGIGGADNVQMANNKWAQFQNDCDEAKINSAVEVEEYEEVNRMRQKGFK